MRTRLKQSLVVGVASSDWEAMSFVVEPFTWREDAIHRIQRRKRFRIDPKKHLLATALEWRKEMASNPHISSADIAKEVGVTAGRVRQILRLTNLHPTIQGDIHALSKSVVRKRYPEMVLRMLIVLPTDQQLERYAAIQFK